MPENKYALVLIGDLLPGFNAVTTWPALANYFRVDEARLQSGILARAPLAIKEADGLEPLEVMRDALAALGAAAEIHVLNDAGNLFVLLEQRPRGPLPHAYIEKQVRSGIWPADIKVAAVGSNEWRNFVDPLPVIPAMPAVATPAGFQTIADGFDRSFTSPAILPPGAAIHAGFWRRCAAYLIDSLVLFIPSVIVGLVPILGLIVSLVGRWLYFALMESSPSQATLGKRAMGLIVTSSNGQRIGFGQATGRYFGGAISTMILYIGYMLAGWTERKQALHDMMADTCVVFDGVRPGQAPLPTIRPPMPWYGWLANCLLLAVIPISILAAISIPAYQDYVNRTKLANVVIDAVAWKLEVSEAVSEGKPCPNERRSSENALIGSIRFDGNAPDCSINMTFSSSAELPADVRAGTVDWTYSDDGWECSSSLSQKYERIICR